MKKLIRGVSCIRNLYVVTEFSLVEDGILCARENPYALHPQPSLSLSGWFFILCCLRNSCSQHEQAAITWPKSVSYITVSPVPGKKCMNKKEKKKRKKEPSL